MNNLLVLCYPTYANVLHLDSKGVSVVLAPDEILNHLVSLGVRVQVVNLSPFPTTMPLLRSGLVMASKEQINPAEYDVCWHMFRDPPQPEVVKFRQESIELFDSHKHIINSISNMEKMYKTEYLPILEKHGIGPKIIDPKGATVTTGWSTCTHGGEVSPDHTMIRLPNYNNNRGDYPERERDRGHVTIEYIDSTVNGMRSFFRVGYSMGQVLPGWIYSSSPDQLIQKTGTCKIKQPHIIPEEFHGSIQAALTEIGVDVCHIEGLYYNGKLKLFDINPYPTTYGNTLKPISDAMAQQIAKCFGWIK